MIVPIFSPCVSRWIDPLIDFLFISFFSGHLKMTNFQLLVVVVVSEFIINQPHIYY